LQDGNKVKKISRRGRERERERVGKRAKERERE